jgi:hypothetical protein
LIDHSYYLRLAEIHLEIGSNKNHLTRAPCMVQQIAYEYARRNANLVLVARREHRLFAIRDNARLLGAEQVLVIAADRRRRQGGRLPEARQRHRHLLRPA